MDYIDSICKINFYICIYFATWYESIAKCAYLSLLAICMYFTERMLDKLTLRGYMLKWNNDDSNWSVFINHIIVALQADRILRVYSIDPASLNLYTWYSGWNPKRRPYSTAYLKEWEQYFRENLICISRKFFIFFYSIRHKVVQNVNFSLTPSDIKSDDENTKLPR